MIRKTKSGYQVVSKKGKPLSLPNISKNEALKRLHQIEWFKAHKEADDIKSYDSGGEVSTNFLSALFYSVNVAIDKSQLVPLSKAIKDKLLRDPNITAKRLNDVSKALNIKKEHIYYNPKSIVSPILYWDTPLYYDFMSFTEPGFSMMQEERRFNQMRSGFEKIVKQKDYYRLFFLMDKKAIIQSFIELYDEIPDKDKYDIFIDIYVRSEGGFRLFPIPLLNDCFSKRTLSKEWAKRNKRLKKKFKGVEKIKIYRGQNKFSRSQESGLSWTTDLKTAVFFANRFDTGEGIVVDKEVTIDEIVDYLDNRGEEEILLFPKSNKTKLADRTNTTFDGSNPDIRYDEGGEVNSNSFMKWYVQWYKSISDKMNIVFSLPSVIAPYKEENVVVLDVFEKINQNIDAKPYLKEIVEKANEYGVVIYLEPTPRHNRFQDNLEKKKKITREYLIEYYKRFGFQLTPNNQFMKLLPKSNPDILFCSGGIAIIGKPETFYERTYTDGTKERFSVDEYEKNIHPNLQFNNGGTMKKVDKGGITYGKSHDEGGIPVKNASTGQMLEVEGGEGIVNKRSMASDKKVKMNGKEMTICEAVSQLNQMEGGVKFSCDDVEHQQFIQAMALGGELERGVRTEKEHIETLKKLYENRITPNQAITEVAKEHIQENPNYYTNLEKMTESKDSSDYFSDDIDEIEKTLYTPTEEDFTEILKLADGDIVDDQKFSLEDFNIKKDFNGNVYDKIDSYLDQSENYCELLPQDCFSDIKVSREEMPQVYENRLAEFMLYLDEKGIFSTIEYGVPVDNLKPLQHDISLSRIKRMIKRLLAGEYFDDNGKLVNPFKRKIIASKDGYILDGHHRWGALRFLSPENTVDVLYIQLPIQDLLIETKKFNPEVREKFLFGGQVGLASKGADKIKVQEIIGHLTNLFDDLFIAPYIYRSNIGASVSGLSKYQVADRNGMSIYFDLKTDFAYSSLPNLHINKKIIRQKICDAVIYFTAQYFKFYLDNGQKARIFCPNFLVVGAQVTKPRVSPANQNEQVTESPLLPNDVLGTAIYTDFPNAAVVNGTGLSLNPNAFYFDYFDMSDSPNIRRSNLLQDTSFSEEAEEVRVDVEPYRLDKMILNKCLTLDVTDRTNNAGVVFTPTFLPRENSGYPQPLNVIYGTDDLFSIPSADKICASYNDNQGFKIVYGTKGIEYNQSNEFISSGNEQSVIIYVDERTVGNKDYSRINIISSDSIYGNTAIMSNDDYVQALIKYLGQMFYNVPDYVDKSQIQVKSKESAEKFSKNKLIPKRWLKTRDTVERVDFDTLIAYTSVQSGSSQASNVVSPQPATNSISSLNNYQPGNIPFVEDVISYQDPDINSAKANSLYRFNKTRPNAFNTQGRMDYLLNRFFVPKAGLYETYTNNMANSKTAKSGRSQNTKTAYGIANPSGESEWWVIDIYDFQEVTNLNNLPWIEINSGAEISEIFKNESFQSTNVPLLMEITLPNGDKKEIVGVVQDLNDVIPLQNEFSNLVAFSTYKQSMYFIDFFISTFAGQDARDDYNSYSSNLVAGASITLYILPGRSYIEELNKKGTKSKKASANVETTAQPQAEDLYIQKTKEIPFSGKFEKGKTYIFQGLTEENSGPRLYLNNRPFTLTNDVLDEFQRQYTGDNGLDILQFRFDENSYIDSELLGLLGGPLGDNTWTWKYISEYLYELKTERVLNEKELQRRNLEKAPEIKNKIKQLNLLSSAFDDDEIQVKEAIQKEITKLKLELQKITNYAYFTDNLHALLDLYVSKISEGQKDEQTVLSRTACGLDTPTGAPSELDAIQYQIVRTESFKLWFGDWEDAYKTKNYDGVSKAINPTTAEPLVVYHGKGGMLNEITRFKLTDTGFPLKYFAVNRSYALNFKNSYPPINIIFEFFVKIINPIDLSKLALENVNVALFKLFIKELYGYEIQTQFTMPDDTMVPLWVILRRNPEVLREIKNNTRYDGFILYENNPQDVLPDGSFNATLDYTVFTSNQAKAADGRNSTFFQNVEDFRFNKGGQTKTKNKGFQKGVVFRLEKDMGKYKKGDMLVVEEVDADGKAKKVRPYTTKDAMKKKELYDLM